MLRYLTLGMLLLLLASHPAFAQSTADTKYIEIHKVKDVASVWSLGTAPGDKAVHTYVITHGLGGVDDRFYELGQAIRARNGQVNVLVVDWTPGADKTI